MKHVVDGPSYILILERGEELISSLSAFCAVHDLKSAWLSGLGGAAEVELGYYDINIKDYHWKTYNQPLEILGLTGNMSIVNGQPFWHIHGIFGDQNYQSIGGHIRRLTIGLTGELRIAPLSNAITRLPDETTGLQIIAPSSEDGAPLTDS